MFEYFSKITQSITNSPAAKWLCIFIILVCGIILIVVSQQEVSDMVAAAKDEHFFDDCDAVCDECTKEAGICGVEVGGGVNVPILIASAPVKAPKWKNDKQQEVKCTLQNFENLTKDFKQNTGEGNGDFVKRGLQLRAEIEKSGYQMSDEQFATMISNGLTTSS